MCFYRETLPALQATMGKALCVAQFTTGSSKSIPFQNTLNEGGYLDAPCESSEHLVARKAFLLWSPATFFQPP